MENPEVRGTIYTAHIILARIIDRRANDLSDQSREFARGGAVQKAHELSEQALRGFAAAGAMEKQAEALSNLLRGHGLDDLPIETFLREVLLEPESLYLELITSDPEIVEAIKVRMPRENVEDLTGARPPIPSPETEENAITPSEPGEKKTDEVRGSERFKLPGGKEVGGRAGQLLGLASEASEQDLLETDRILEFLYPGVDSKVALVRLRNVVADARKALKGSGLYLENELSPVERKQGQKGGYYLRTGVEKADAKESAKPPVEDGFRVEDKDVAAEVVRRLLEKLEPFNAHNVVTNEELLTVASTPNPKTMSEYLEEVKRILTSKGFKLAFVPNPNYPKNIGYYVELVRSPKIHLTLIGDIVRYGDQQLRLTEEEYKLLWALSLYRESPVFESNLSTRAFNEQNPEASNLARVATSLDSRLGQLTGAKEIVVSVGNEAFGIFYKIKDTRLTRKGGYAPVHPSRLEALGRIFQDLGVKKEEIISTLGLTRGRRYLPRLLTSAQALLALRRSIARLDGRASENITTERENEIYLEMGSYMSQLNLDGQEALIAHIARILGVSYARPVVDEDETSEPGDVDEQIRSIETEEFGPLSRADVSIMAATLRHHKARLTPFLKQRGIKPLEDSTIIELIDLVGDDPIAQLGMMTEEQMNVFLNDYRVRAFEKVRGMLANPDLQAICERIYEQNPNVWALLVNLSELSQVIEESSESKEGILFIKELIATPIVATFVIDTRTNLVAAIRFGNVDEPPHQQELAAYPNDNVVQSLAEDGAPAEVGEEEVVQVEVTPTTGPDILKVEPIEPKPKAIEKRDPDLRAIINQYLDDILQRPEFSAPVTGMALNRVYPRLKKFTVEKALEGNWLKLSFDRDNHPRFDAVAAAALLYLYDHGDNLPNKLRRQVQTIAAEEYLKR